MQESGIYTLDHIDQSLTPCVMDWEKIVGANIRRYRKVSGLTQEQLPRSADLDLRYLGGSERGEHNPTVAVLACLAEALDVHPRDFFDEEEAQPQQ